MFVPLQKENHFHFTQKEFKMFKMAKNAKAEIRKVLKNNNSPLDQNG